MNRSCYGATIGKSCEARYLQCPLHYPQMYVILSQAIRVKRSLDHFFIVCGYVYDWVCKTKVQNLQWPANWTSDVLLMTSNFVAIATECICHSHYWKPLDPAPLKTSCMLQLPYLGGANTEGCCRGCIGQLTNLQPKKFLHWIANLLNSGTRNEEERQFKVQLQWPSCTCAVTLYLLQ